MKLAELTWLCAREQSAEKDAWRSVLSGTVGALASSGRASSALVQEEGRLLQVVDGDHRFKDGDHVRLVPDVSCDSAQAVKDALIGAEHSVIEGITSRGDLVVGHPVGSRGRVWVLPSEPLIEVYDWQRDIINRLLDVPEPARRLAPLLWALNAPRRNADSFEVPVGQEAESVYRSVLACRGITLVQGPPGCGKTHLSSELIRMALDDGLRVGVFAFTNRACDEVIRTTASRFPEVAGRLARVGNRGGYSRELAPLGVGSAKSIGLDTESRAWATTLYRLSKEVHGALGGALPDLDLAIIDEASQATVPMIVAAAALADRVLLVGDQQQLPPLLHTKPEKPRQCELYLSAFEYLADRLKPHFLSRTRRMCPAVCEVPSKAFYGGRLASILGAGAWAPEFGRDHPLLGPRPGIQLLSVDRSSLRAGKTSPEEAEVIRRIIRLFEDRLAEQLDSFEGAVDGRSGLRYLISCFYRAQVGLVRSHLGGTAESLGS